jgi:hypothetical protein
MSAESHKRYLEKRALGEAQKAIDRHGRQCLRKEDFAALRIQTVEPWKRVCLGLFGALFVGAGFYAFHEGAPGFAVAFFGVGAFCALASIFGRKKTIDTALESIDFLYVLDAF